MSADPSPITTTPITPNPLIVLAATDLHDGDCCARNFCRTCGSHVSGYNANDPLIKYRPEGDGADYWVACDNADCENAYGDEMFMGVPDWVEVRK